VKISRQTLKIEQIRPNPDNPRSITEEKFHLLVDSIKTAPWMLQLRPLVIDEENIVLGGNQRLRALKEAGIKEVLVEKIEGATEKEKEEFIIKDNVPFGAWDYDLLANEYDAGELQSWGLDIWNPELDLDEFFEDTEDEEKAPKTQIVLDYSADDYEKVIEAFSQLQGSREAIVMKLLGL